MFPKKHSNNQHRSGCYTLYGNTGEYTTRTRKIERKKTKRDFFEDFCNEIDIFAEKVSFPDWVFQFREKQLKKISPPMKKLCRNLKSLEIPFKIKYPVEIFEKWKFADIYIPHMDAVILVLSSYKEFNRPCNLRSERAEFFEHKFKVIELYEYNAGDIDILTESLKLQ